MATTTPSTNSTSAPTSRKKQPFPPEERFWKHYSPHHEFPLSSVASVVIHALAIAVLVLGGILLARLGWGEKQVPIDSIEVIPGGGGSPSGADGQATGTGKKEDVAPESADTKAPRGELPKEELKKVEPTHNPIVNPETEAPRPIDVDPSAGLSKASDKLRDMIEHMQQGGTASKGKGGTGEGGGKGSGKGTGQGPGTGTGKIKSERQKRQARWTMIFNTFNGDDYARQLIALGAILAIDGPSGQLLVIDDLRRRPVSPQAKDVVPDRIFWIDDRPQSVGSLAQALGISPLPQRIVAFFPEELEKELLRKELNHHHLREDQIFETKFQVQRRGSGYEPLVVEQTRNR
jgi:hypothetical protein